DLLGGGLGVGAVQHVLAAGLGPDRRAVHARRPEVVVPGARAAVGAGAVHALAVHGLAVAVEDVVVLAPGLVDRDHGALAVGQDDEALLHLVGDGLAVVLVLLLGFRRGGGGDEGDGDERGEECQAATRT